MKSALPPEFSSEQDGMSRRRFIQLAGVSALGASSLGRFHRFEDHVALVSDPADPVAASGPSQWALQELETSLASRGIRTSRHPQLSQGEAAVLTIVAAGSASNLGRQLLRDANTAIPAVSEALGLVPAAAGGREVLLACGTDTRGLVYALLELADRVRWSERPLEGLTPRKPLIEQPANAVRSLTRLFVSETEDKPWFNDRAMWESYLSMLAAQRFNRFSLSLGIGYDFLQNVTDAYFLFAYPFFLSVPGSPVRVPQLPEAERRSNLEMLKFISGQTAARGMQFQLGLWMHGYQWLNSPNPNYTIEGLTRETHGPYCRDALRQLLQACPDIAGVTFRIHGESGVSEGSYDFWKTVFDGVAACGRTVGIDLHTKGIDTRMIDLALATGMPVTVSPKYWAEHLGLPYHQADIRAFEIPKPGVKVTGLMSLSAGSRSFTRYGYADLLREDRRYGVVHRIWPGTQRLLLWGDPEMSAAYARAFAFCGSSGVELMEPLSFKGRRGSGIAGGRCGYQDSSLKPRWDWEKYLYSLRVFGRLTYNPGTEPDVWRRALKQQLGAGARPAEEALANASRILPIVLTAHGVSAANNLYWPEIYTNLSIADPDNKNPFFDTPSPKVFGNVSPMDPQLFLGINDYAREILKGERSGKYSPVEYAQWVEDCADAAARSLAEAKTKTGDTRNPEFRRMAADVTIAAGLGRFFGAKFRSGVLYAIFEQTGDRAALEQALAMYRRARSFWAGLAASARDVYVPDITVGEDPVIRGHWLDRLPAIDDDIRLMEKKLNQLPPGALPQKDAVRQAIQDLGRPARKAPACRHDQPAGFRPAEPLEIALSAPAMIRAVRLYYRHVNHAERYESAGMDRAGDRFHAVIPAPYTGSPYPLQYYFELREDPGNAWLYPGLGDRLTRQPYYVLRKS